MKIIIGANAFLSNCLLEEWHKQNILLVGRKPSQKILEYKLNFIETNYANAKEVSAILRNQTKMEVIFAGISSEPALIIDANPAKLMNDFELNVIFSLEIIKYLLPEMIRQNYGRFIFIGSQESDLGVIGGVGYSIIKNSQKAINTNLAIEYRRFNITSNIVRIGYLGEGYSSKLPAKRKKELFVANNGGFRTNPKHVAKAIDEVLSDKNMNGKTFDV